MASSIEVSEEAGVRYLHFGSRWVQGAMRVQRPWALELEYTREMLLPLVLRPEPGLAEERAADRAGRGVAGRSSSTATARGPR